MASTNDNSGEVISLNIMPMLDIFSILILFLLMNFSTDPMSYELHKSMDLPYSDTTISLDEVPVIVATKSLLKVNDKVITEIKDGQVNEKHIKQGAILPLYNELKKISDSAKKLSNKKINNNKKLTLEIDKSHKFSFIKKIMLAAQQADFIEFKLMVAKKNT